MEWIRTNYDRAAALAARAFSSFFAPFFIFLGASGFGERFSALRNVPPPNNKIPAGKAPEIVEAMQKIAGADAVDLDRTLRSLRPGKAFYRGGWAACDSAEHPSPSACA